MDGIKSKTLYVVIEFDETDYKKPPLVDLVPRNWLTATPEGKLFCKWPDTTTAKKMDNFVQDRNEPGPNWIEYPVLRIVRQAQSYEQGVRRLIRTTRNLEVAPSRTDVHSHLSAVGDPQLNQNLRASLGPNPNMNLTAFLNDLGISNILDVNCNDQGSWNNPSNTIDMLKQHLNEKLNEIEINLTEKIESAKKSILCDIEEKVLILKNDLLPSPALCTREASTALQEMDKLLPIMSLIDFIEFDANLQNNEQQRDTLLYVTPVLEMQFRRPCHTSTATVKGLLYRGKLKKSFFIALINGSKSTNNDIARIMAAVIGKPVQLQYSGLGRKTANNYVKLNFSATATFECMKEVLEDKFSNDAGNLNLLSTVSRWLVRASSREGGQRNRNNSV